MTNKMYARGRAKEYRVKKQLESEGWFVIRSAGSHSIVDLVAFKGFVDLDKVPAVWDTSYGTPPNNNCSFRFIQCKPKGGYLSPEERAKKKELEERLHITIEVL